MADETLFQNVKTDGDYDIPLREYLIEVPLQYVIWGGGRLRLTVNELMDVVLLG
ncbi:MAG TPA: hypothetical protein VF531_11145 [Bacillota bacterium]